MSGFTFVHEVVKEEQEMIMKKRLIAASAVALLVFALLVSSSLAVAQSASLKIAEAENALRVAAKIVIEAEKVGANVSELVADLNRAADLLADAVTASANGNDGQATSLAENSKSLAENVSAEASELKSLYSQSNILLSTVAFSGLGILVFLGILAAIWIAFKRAYTRRMLKMRPEVVPNVAS